MTHIEPTGDFDATAYHDERRKAEREQGSIPYVYWTEPGLKITRLRLLSDPGFPAWDVSYCHGMLDGKHVTVQLPFHQLPKRKVYSAIIAHAKRDRVYAKGIGILDCISQLSF